MPTYIVPTEGDPAQAAGRLALAGIQSLASFHPGGSTSARLRAESPEEALQRVNAALGDDFAISDPIEE